MPKPRKKIRRGAPGIPRSARHCKRIKRSNLSFWARVRDALDLLEAKEAAERASTEKRAAEARPDDLSDFALEELYREVMLDDKASLRAAEKGDGHVSDS